MEFLKSKPRRSHATEAAYAALNVALAIIILLVVLSTQSIWLPLGLVLLSKWRVFAVRPRFWLANILANLVDILVGLSYVVILVQASGVLWFQIAFTAAYIIWLLVIKPRSKRVFIVAQALIALFLSVNALAMVTYGYDVIFFVLGMWVIGFVTHRHVLMNYSDPLVTYLSLVGGLFMAEIGWLGYHWLFSYGLSAGSGLQVAQLAIIATLIAFLSERVYEVYHRNQTVRAQDIMLPMVFSASLIVVMVLFFNNIAPTGSL